jgi:hypothetical protein
VDAVRLSDVYAHFAPSAARLVAERLSAAAPAADPSSDGILELVSLDGWPSPWHCLGCWRRQWWPSGRIRGLVVAPTCPEPFGQVRAAA